jgi:nuclease HARBI1
MSSCGHLRRKTKGERLQHTTGRNNPLSVHQQLLTFLPFVGTNSFYHVTRDCHNLSTNSVFRIIHRVIDALFELRNEFVKFPDSPLSTAAKFKEIAGIPCVIGAIDGTHVSIIPPKPQEAAFVNRHHGHSFNVVMVCGPELTFYYANISCPGSNVIKPLCL